MRCQTFYDKLSYSLSYTLQILNPMKEHGNSAVTGTSYYFYRYRDLEAARLQL